MNGRNRHRAWAQIHLRKKGRRTRLLVPKGPVAAKLAEIGTIALHSSYTAKIYGDMLI
jgi:hypothetical protein